MSIKSVIKPLIPPAIWAEGRRLASRRHLRTFPRRVVEHVYHDQKLRVLIADSLAEAWYDHDGGRMHEIDRLRSSRLKPGAVVFDCGAHQAVVAIILAGCCAPNGRVVAVEANPHNAQIARGNVRLNESGRAPAEIVEAALSGRVGRLKFNENLNGQFSHGSNRDAGQFEVSALTLNTLVERFGAPDVIFLDIEGAEWSALQACADVFHAGNRPDWFVEVHVGAGLEALGGSAPQVVDFFHARGYTLKFSPNDGQPFEPLGSELPVTRFFLLALHESTCDVTPDVKTHNANH